MIEVSKKYGCLTVLDMGEEYSRTEAYSSLIEKKDKLENKINNQDDFDNFRFEKYYLKEELSNIKSKLCTHYKCRCKCGKIYYYNAETIENKPRYCFYPIPISTRLTYSNAAADATYRKKQKYANLENVVLLDKSKCIPSEDYCENYNIYKRKQIEKNEEALKMEISMIPRVNAKNYEIDFVGKQYESLYIEECCNDYLESEPVYRFSQQHQKKWDKIIVYKQYRCKCVLCGKEYYIKCDKFGIYPPTEYGYHAYNGYWSDISCDCHQISSFQWIVNKLLFENNVPYRVEYSFPNLRGVFYNLKFDFAIFNVDGSLKCLVECQGEQHYKAVDEFGGEWQFNNQVKNDNKKREYCKKNNIQLIEISYKDKKYERIEEILKKYAILK